MKKFYALLTFTLIALLFSRHAHSETVINITHGNAAQLSIAVVPFAQAETYGFNQLSTIINKDLSRTGDFAPFALNNMLSQPSHEQQVIWRDWRLSQQQFLVIGDISPSIDGVAIHFSLFDVNQQKKLLSKTISVKDYQQSKAAHLISDKIYQKIQGIKGIANTKLLYVTVDKYQGHQSVEQHYRLIVANAGGGEERVVLSSREPILSPSWSPDGRSFAYVSYETGNSAIYIQNLLSGTRERVVAYRGINGSPSWSPQGDKLALTLSKDGNTEIYLYDLRSRTTQRLSRNAAIDTEPSWFPDGESLVFTSSRGGSPQLYRLWINKRKATRLTYKGKYNAKGKITPDGKYLIFVHMKNNRFHIAAKNLRKGTIQLLTKTTMDESLSIAPNGREVVFATTLYNVGTLGIVALHNGKTSYIPTQSRHLREPAWSPYLP